MSRCLPLVPQERTLVWHAPKTLRGSNVMEYRSLQCLLLRNRNLNSCQKRQRRKCRLLCSNGYRIAASVCCSSKNALGAEKGAQVAGRRTRSRRGRPSEYAVNLGGHDEVVLMQSLDLLGLQRDRRISPTEADIRMMAFGFREFTNLLNKDKRVAEIAKPEAPLDAVSFLRQLPVWGVCVKELGLLAREWRYSPATGSTGFASKSFGHVVCPSSRIRLANCEGECCGADAVRLNHPRRDLVRSIGGCPASPPTPYSRAG